MSDQGRNNSTNHVSSQSIITTTTSVADPFNPSVENIPCMQYTCNNKSKERIEEDIDQTSDLNGKNFRVFIQIFRFKLDRF